MAAVVLRVGKIDARHITIRLLLLGVVMTMTDDVRSPSPERSCGETIVSYSRECKGGDGVMVIAVEYFLLGARRAGGGES